MTAGVEKMGDHDGPPAPPKKKKKKKENYFRNIEHISWGLCLLTRTAVINKRYFYFYSQEVQEYVSGQCKRGSMALISSSSQNLTHPQECCEARIPWTERGWTIHATLSLAGIEQHKMRAELL